MSCGSQAENSRSRSSRDLGEQLEAPMAVDQVVKRCRWFRMHCSWCSVFVTRVSVTSQRLVILVMMAVRGSWGAELLRDLVQDMVC